MTLRSLFLASFSVVLLFAGAACRRETRVQAGDREQILHLGNMSEPSDLDPQVVTSLQDFQIILSLFEGLTNYHPQTCEPVPGVAERWEPSANGLTWTFRLRADAKWSNGDPVTAGDFVYSYQRILSANLGSEYAYMLYCLRGAEDFNTGKLTAFADVGVKAPDERTLVFTLKNPVPYFPGLLAHSAWYPVHRATIEKFGKMDQRGTLWTRPGNLVGNGPFLLVDWKPNQVIRVTASPTYWDRAQIKLREVNFYPIDSQPTEEAAFRSGQLHLTAQIPPDKIAVYKRDHPELLHQETNLATYFYRFNVAKPPLDDVRVRRALSMAIDRKQIVDNVSRGDQVPAFFLTPPDTAGYTAEVTFAENLAEARKLLAEAGYPDGKGFPKVDVLYNTTEGHRLIAEAIQQMWRKHLDIDVTLSNQEAKVYTDTMRQGNYQIARYAWVGDYLDPSTFLELMTSTSGNNQTGWANPEYDRLVTQAGRTADQRTRFALYREAEKLLMTEMPIMPIYFYVRNNLRRPQLKGWYGNLLDLHAFKGVYLESPADATR